MKNIISTIVQLGDKLRKIDNSTIDKAIAECGWFTSDSIMFAINAIVSQYLKRDKLEKWLNNYTYTATSKQQNIAVIMAGNIPLVGLFDMLSVLVSGNKCLYKPSSKDSILMEYVVSMLKELDPNIPLKRLNDSSEIDALIATGGDNAIRVFKQKYKEIPAIFRDSKFSIAVLSGKETTLELQKLGVDIFMHSGLGCRNVSMVFAPQNYDISILGDALKRHSSPSRKYHNNYLQNRAMLIMNEKEFFDGEFFTITEEEMPSHIISNINVARYIDINQVDKWATSNIDKIQCVVSNITEMDTEATPIGCAQSPELTNYPDRIDTLTFLLSLNK